MYLHEDREQFLSVIDTITNSSDTDIKEAYLEKDYYVTMFLKLLSQRQPEIIFKGGTSLSKCQKVINRFSEDIDLSLICENKPTEGQRRHLKANIKDVAEELGLEITNLEETRSRRDFNRYKIAYPKIYTSANLKQELIIETVVFMRSYPTEKFPVKTIMEEELEGKIPLEFLEQYNLGAFTMNVQTLERTFVDKVFALCDYFLRDAYDGQSRHIYDLHCIYQRIELNDELRDLFEEVRQERKRFENCISAQDYISLKGVLIEFIECERYRKAYERTTYRLITDGVTYDEAIVSLKKIAKWL